MTEEVDPVAIVQKWMLELAEKIADQADAAADSFKTAPGDVALRAFADGIRRTNAKSGYIKSETGVADVSK